MLSRLGLGLPKRILQDPQLFVVRAIDVPRRLERYYQRHYINMDRLEFDRWLLSMAPPGVDLRLGCRLLGYGPQAEGFRLVLDRGGRQCEETARIVVGADGATSRVRGQLGPGAPPKMYFAIQEWVEAGGSVPYFSSIFDPRITDYYCWTIPKADHLIIGAALRQREDTARKFEQLKSQLKAWGFRLGWTIRREGGFILRPRRLRELSIGVKGVPLVGEAGGWISPSSAEGFSYAFRSALVLAEALRSGWEGFEERYCRKMRVLRSNILLKHLKSHLLFHPWFRKVVMKSGLQSMDLYEPESGNKRS
jgi:flavin-dependent dehydrogenase